MQASGSVQIVGYMGWWGQRSLPYGFEPNRPFLCFSIEASESFQIWFTDVFGVADFISATAVTDNVLLWMVRSHVTPGAVIPNCSAMFFYGLNIQISLTHGVETNIILTFSAPAEHLMDWYLNRDHVLRHRKVMFHSIYTYPYIYVCSKTSSMGTYLQCRTPKLVLEALW